ncbi:hypothetical protein [Streptomyces halobius]|uniref:Uncharacterized protein n=1 Tax=Streptomyces halobius TaxID=2879846 RepID=A0ABY4MAN2_9ACTN|nr:hypothetical protein [Streptomyces halobius]UQA94473.1 hypothetical protein K9S39_23750 [Streptomyces halobius]
MTYAVTVDTQIASGAPEMDELQRVGAGALLEQGFDSVESIDGPDGVEVEIADTWVGVHPGGALLKVFVVAPALEFAEEAVRALVEELLERSELLADWTVERCEVELHPDLAKESLEAADGPDAPPDDLASRRARLIESAAGDAAVGTTSDAVDTEAAQRRMRSMAARLRSFGPEMFGVPDEEEKDDDLAEYGSRVAADDAELAAGALVWATDVLLDELFQDAYALAAEETNVAECDRPMWLLDELPPHYVLQYDARFARRFLVTAVALTTRFTGGSFEQLSCVAEELVLRLLLDRAEVTLETFGLLDEGVSSALECFAAMVYEDMDHEWLYDDSKDGIDESPVGEYLGVAPMGLASWFKPFNDDRYVHPYAGDEPFAEER